MKQSKSNLKTNGHKIVKESEKVGINVYMLLIDRGVSEDIANDVQSIVSDWVHYKVRDQLKSQAKYAAKILSKVEKKSQKINNLYERLDHEFNELTAWIE